MSSYRRLDTNVPGSFYVNAACIDCDTCRQLAPEVFSEVRGYSAVTKQPVGEEETRRALHALLACPTAAIGTEQKDGVEPTLEDFPLQVENNVYYCGFTSSKSYGGSSYLILRPDGNWLVDSPRYVPALVRKLESMGGIRTIFLTHRDDVADAKRYAEHFAAERIIHAAEKSAQPDAEHILEGTASMQWDPEMEIVMTPGHTRGHMVLLYRNRYLFTGDHLAWDRQRQALMAHEDHCWYSWEEQKRSMRQLAERTFAWVLPGHGQRIKLEPERMKQAMTQLIAGMYD